ncbi:ATP-binding cassette domain-containing protein [Limnobacter humi]|uniref:ATP-binding cassette domain-containing protein n=1 Tax=Limnobacter humi TaxID=1778671 RepID=A0ABT1WG60_9BURK|nr:ATP-binding cassette domain-containing protein [Limnobacter humi]MCQ8895898.1 ATP-binding cassette domain-containing protein [Limnobacter humi]
MSENTPPTALKARLAALGQPFHEHLWAQISSSNPANTQGPGEPALPPSLAHAKAYLDAAHLPYRLHNHVTPDEWVHLGARALRDENWALEITPRDSSPVQKSKSAVQGLLDFWQTLSQSRWLMDAIRESLPQLKPVITASVLINLLALSGPFFSIQVYDRIIPNSAYASLWALLTGVAISLVFEHTLKHARHTLLEHAATQADIQCANQLAKALLNTRPQSTDPATLLQHLRSFEQLRELVSGLFLVALVDLPFLLLFLAIIAIIHPLFLIIAGLATGAALLAVWIAHRRMAASSQAHMQSSRHCHLLWIDQLANLEPIQNYGVQWPVAEKIATAQLRSRLDQNTVRNLLFDNGQWLHLIQQTSWLASIALGVALVVDQHISVGGLIAVSMLTLRCFGPIQKLQSQLVHTQSAQAHFMDLHQFLSQSMGSPHAPQHPADSVLTQLSSVSLESVTALKPGQTLDTARRDSHLLKNVHLNLQAGDRVAIIGAMGSGKTSLLRALAAQLPLARGLLRINHLDHRQFHPAELGQHIGMAHNPPHLIQGTLLDNIRFYRQNIGPDACERVLRSLGAQAWLASLPAGLNTPIEPMGANLSSGQRQWVSLARALCGNPNLVLLDEPTACLDAQAEQAFIHTLSELPASCIVVLTTHRLNLLGSCNHLILMQGGEIHAQGGRAEVLAAAQALSQGGKSA